MKFMQAGTDLYRPYVCFSSASQSDTISDKTLVSQSPHRPWSYLQDPINEHYCMYLYLFADVNCYLGNTNINIEAWDKKLLQSVTIKHLDSQVHVRDTS